MELFEFISNDEEGKTLPCLIETWASFFANPDGAFMVTRLKWYKSKELAEKNQKKTLPDVLFI